MTSISPDRSHRARPANDCGMRSARSKVGMTTDTSGVIYGGAGRLIGGAEHAPHLVAQPRCDHPENGRVVLEVAERLAGQRADVIGAPRTDEAGRQAGLYFHDELGEIAARQQAFVSLCVIAEYRALRIVEVGGGGDQRL